MSKVLYKARKLTQDLISVSVEMILVSLSIVHNYFPDRITKKLTSDVCGRTFAILIQGE